MSPDTEQHFDVTPDRLRHALEDAIRTLGYRVIGQTDSGLSFNTGLSVKSWAGQDLTAKVASDGGKGSVLTLEGQTAKLFGVLPRQLYAWGEKGSLERRVIAEVRKRVAAT